MKRDMTNYINKENDSGLSGNLISYQQKSLLFKKRATLQQQMNNSDFELRNADALWSTRTLHESSRGASPSTITTRTNSLFDTKSMPS